MNGSWNGRTAISNCCHCRRQWVEESNRENGSYLGRTIVLTLNRQATTTTTLYNRTHTVSRRVCVCVCVKTCFPSVSFLLLLFWKRGRRVSIRVHHFYCSNDDRTHVSLLHSTVVYIPSSLTISFPLYNTRHTSFWRNIYAGWANTVSDCPPLDRLLDRPTDRPAFSTCSCSCTSNPVHSVQRQSQVKVWLFNKNKLNSKNGGVCQSLARWVARSVVEWWWWCRLYLK